MTAESLARALGGRRVGTTWMGCCPAHEDRTPSLAIRERDGRVLVHCHGGCDQRDVIAALRADGLWDDAGPSKWAEWRDGIRYPADWGTPIAEYRYTDGQGEYLYSVVRFTPKSFRPGYYDGGRWTWRKHPQPILYHLPEVLESPIVFIVEGEKDAETLRDWGFIATTAAGGAKAPWLDSYTAALAGRECILIPDRDEPGRRRVAQIARAILGVALKVTILELADGKDVTEWFERGHSECELIAQLEGCHAI